TSRYSPSPRVEVFLRTNIGLVSSFDEIGFSSHVFFGDIGKDYGIEYNHIIKTFILNRGYYHKENSIENLHVVNIQFFFRNFGNPALALQRHLTKKSSQKTCWHGGGSLFFPSIYAG
ncbi:unnamed protein product, partial [Prunus brigantina]